jgi:hypothetical protein
VLLVQLSPQQPSPSLPHDVIGSQRPALGTEVPQGSGVIVTVFCYAAALPRASEQSEHLRQLHQRDALIRSATPRSRLPSGDGIPPHGPLWQQALACSGGRWRSRGDDI